MRKIVAHHVSRVNQAVHSVEAVRLHSVGNISSAGALESRVLQSLRKTVDPGGCGLSIDSADTKNRLRVVANWTNSSSTKSLVGEFTLFVEHADKTFAVDFLEVRLGLS